MLFDIHSHILPAVDDGAKDLTEALNLLEIMQSQGITDCIATPHFYPHEDNLEDFLQTTNETFSHLKQIANERSLPNIYLGCEMLYYKGIGTSQSLSDLCLNGSGFLLLELTDGCIDEALFEDLKALKNERCITPIIAHIERYYKAKKYRKLLKFIQQEKIPAQINASSVFIGGYRRVIKKLITSGIAYVVATDSHSVKERPPRLAEALSEIGTKYGKEQSDRLLKNSEMLYSKIVMEKKADA